MSLFGRAEITSMRDRTASRNYSAARDEFRREHERHRAWGLQRRHAEKLRRIRGAVSAGRSVPARPDPPASPLTLPDTREVSAASGSAARPSAIPPPAAQASVASLSSVSRSTAPPSSVLPSRVLPSSVSSSRLLPSSQALLAAASPRSSSPSVASPPPVALTPSLQRAAWMPQVVPTRSLERVAWLPRVVRHPSMPTVPSLPSALPPIASVPPMAAPVALACAASASSGQSSPCRVNSVKVPASGAGRRWAPPPTQRLVGVARQVRAGSRVETLSPGSSGRRATVCPADGVGLSFLASPWMVRSVGRCAPSSRNAARKPTRARPLNAWLIVRKALPITFLPRSSHCGILLTGVAGAGLCARFHSMDSSGSGRAYVALQWLRSNLGRLYDPYCSRDGHGFLKISGDLPVPVRDLSGFGTPSSVDSTRSQNSTLRVHLGRFFSCICCRVGAVGCGGGAASARRTRCGPGRAATWRGSPGPGRCGGALLVRTGEVRTRRRGPPGPMWSAEGWGFSPGCAAGAVRGPAGRCRPPR
jgi:hypothetical protein